MFYDSDVDVLALKNYIVMIQPSDCDKSMKL